MKINFTRYILAKAAKSSYADFYELYEIARSQFSWDSLGSIYHSRTSKAVRLEYDLEEVMALPMDQVEFVFDKVFAGLAKHVKFMDVGPGSEIAAIYANSRIVNAMDLLSETIRTPPMGKSPRDQIMTVTFLADYITRDLQANQEQIDQTRSLAHEFFNQCELGFFYRAIQSMHADKEIKEVINPIFETVFKYAEFDSDREIEIMSAIVELRMASAL